MQNKKECKIELTHPSYALMYQIFKKYTENHLQDLLLNQVAYNCAIRALYIDNPCFQLEEFFDASSYGLDTYDGLDAKVVCMNDGEMDVLLTKHNLSKLFLDYPFIDGNTHGIKIKDRYPPITKPLDAIQKRILKEQLDADIESDSIFIPLIQKEKDPIKKFEEVIRLDANELTKAFYYFDALEFYKCSQSMIARTYSSISADKNKTGHDQRKIKRYKQTMNYLILEKKYFTLI